MSNWLDSSQVDRTTQEYQERHSNVITTFMDVTEFFPDKKLARIRWNQIDGTIWGTEPEKNIR